MNELELLRIAYEASLELQTTLLDRCERLQQLADRQRQIIETHNMLAETAPNPAIPEKVRPKE